MSDMPRLRVNPDYPTDDQPLPATENISQFGPSNQMAEATTESSDRMPSQKGFDSMKKKMPVALAAVAIVAGVLTGLGAQRLAAKSGIASDLTGGPQPVSQIAGDSINNGDVFGVPDEKTFKDSAEGYLEIGGLNGEGSHKLLREGGDSQTVYLTSSITDLDKFDGMQVKVWGETFKAQTAGWLMDVGRVQVVNTQGSQPSE